MIFSFYNVFKVKFFSFLFLPIINTCQNFTEIDTFIKICNLTGIGAGNIREQEQIMSGLVKADLPVLSKMIEEQYSK
jgi:hypothetical protein